MNKKQANQRVWVGKGRNSVGSHWTVQTAPQGLSLWKHKAGYWQRSCGHKKAGLKYTLGTGSSSFHTNKTQTSKKIQRSVRQVENGDNVQDRCWTPPLWLVQWFHNSDELRTFMKKMLLEINIRLYCNLWATPHPHPWQKGAFHQQYVL